MHSFAFVRTQHGVEHTCTVRCTPIRALLVVIFVNPIFLVVQLQNLLLSIFRVLKM
jgi:hypothetical protein